MHTEPIHVPSTKPADQKLSGALLSSYPHRCLITSESGKPVGLTWAGYVLSFETTYHIRFSEPIKELRLVGFPNQFIHVQNESGTTRKHAVDYRMIPIRASLPSFWEKISHHGTYAHDLELEITFADDRRTTMTIPIILQQNLTLSLLILSGIFALAWAAFEVVGRSFFEWDFEGLFRTSTWLALMAAIAYALLLRIPRQIWTFYWRAAELRKRFESRWRKSG